MKKKKVKGKTDCWEMKDTRRSFFSEFVWREPSHRPNLIFLSSFFGWQVFLSLYTADGQFMQSAGPASPVIFSSEFE